MNVLDLFSGIGGFSLGLERAGMRTVAFCEIDPYCQAVLRKHWPDVPVWGDVRTFDGEAIANIISKRGPHASGRIDVICGGFPCQDISVAGKGAGIEGSHSGLWSEYARIIGEVRPRYVIVENVAALLGRGIERVLGDLAALGFDAEWHCIPAAAVGAPHRRDRVWIVAYPMRERRQQIAGSPHGDEAENEGRPAQYDHQPASNGQGNGTADMANADAQRRGRRANDQGAFREPSRSDWWSVEPDVGGSLDGFPKWLDRYCGRGLSYAESCRRNKMLHDLWSTHVSQALRRAAGGLERLQQAEVLFSFMREYEMGSDQARLLVEGEEASEDFLRGLRRRAITPSTSHRSKHKEQSSTEHSDALQAMSRLLASDSEATWANCGWEDATPRVARAVANRVDRLRALGNAIVPQIAEIIGRAIIDA